MAQILCIKTATEVAKVGDIIGNKRYPNSHVFSEAEHAKFNIVTLPWTDEQVDEYVSKIEIGRGYLDGNKYTLIDSLHDEPPGCVWLWKKSNQNKWKLLSNNYKYMFNWTGSTIVNNIEEDPENSEEVNT